MHCSGSHRDDWSEGVDQFSITAALTDVRIMTDLYELARSITILFLTAT